MQSILNSLGIEGQFLLLTAIGFLCLFLVLKKYLFGPVQATLQARQDSIRGNIDEAESRRNEMVRLQKEYETRLAQVEDEARNQIQAAVKEAQAARDEILTRAQADSAHILERGREDAVRERDQAMLQMRNEIIDLSITAAGKVIHQSLNDAAHTKIVDDMIAGIGRGGSGTVTSGGAG